MSPLSLFLSLFLFFSLFFADVVFSHRVVSASFGSWVAFWNISAATSLQLPIFLLSFGAILVLGFSRSTPQSALWRSSVLMAFGFLQGIFVSPLIATVSATDPSIPLKAFLLTVLVFACFSLSALLNTSRAYLYASSMIGAALMGLLALAVMNSVVQTPAMQNVYLFGGLLLFAFFVAFDTQIIIERALCGDSDSVNSALDLFLDALNIFIRIMLILNNNKKSQGGGSSIV